MKCEDDTYVVSFPTIKQQIRADMISSRHLHEEEYKQFQKQMNHLEDNKKLNILIIGDHM